MKTYVLDTSALTTFFEDRPGADEVENLLAKADEVPRYSSDQRTSLFEG